MKILRIVFACFLVTLCVTDTPESVPPVQYPELAQVLVVHFHRIHQCTCCINVGMWAEETIIQYFPDEYASGKIVYMDVCIEENPDMAKKYNAYGASLFINVIKEGNDTIIDALEVWEHCHDHDTYVAVFKHLLEDALKV